MGFDGQLGLKSVNKSKRLISKLREAVFDFNHLFILECYKYPEDREFLDEYTIPSLKDFTLSSAHQFLVKEGYIVADPENSEKFILSVKGEDFLDNLKGYTATQGELIVIKPIRSIQTLDDKFEEWWKLYPRTGTWETEDKSRKYVSSRNLKNLKKEKAKEKYLALLNQKLSHEELMGGLKYEIKLKKLDSVKTNSNKMEYFKGMESYLNSQQYLNFMEEFRANPGFVDDTHDIKGKKLNVKDI